MHLMNTTIKTIPHPEIKNNGEVPSYRGCRFSDNKQSSFYEIRTDALLTHQYRLMSPELKDKNRKVISGKRISGVGYRLKRNKNIRCASKRIISKKVFQVYLC